MPQGFTIRVDIISDQFSEILEAEAKASARLNKRAGGLIRGIARRSVKRRKKKKSLPGNPPFTHVSGNLGAKSILWDYNPRTRILRVGPTDKANTKEGMRALEFGGRAPIKLTSRQRRKYKKKYYRALIKKRPTMAPAGAAFERSYPDLYKDAF